MSGYSVEEWGVLDLEVRELIAYGLIAMVLVAASGWSLAAQRKRRIRKLRLAGNGAVKQAELQRRR